MEANFSIVAVFNSIKCTQQTSLTHLASAFSDSTPDIATRAAAAAAGSSNGAAGGGEPRITLDELSDLYRRAESDRDPGVDAAIPPGEIHSLCFIRDSLYGTVGEILEKIRDRA